MFVWLYIWYKIVFPYYKLRHDLIIYIKNNYLTCTASCLFFCDIFCKMYFGCCSLMMSWIFFVFRLVIKWSRKNCFVFSVPYAEKYNNVIKIPQKNLVRSSVGLVMIWQIEVLNQRFRCRALDFSPWQEHNFREMFF